MNSAQTDSGSGPGRTRLFTLFILACMHLLMLNDGINTCVTDPRVGWCPPGFNVENPDPEPGDTFSIGRFYEAFWTWNRLFQVQKEPRCDVISITKTCEIFWLPFGLLAVLDQCTWANRVDSDTHVVLIIEVVLQSALMFCRCVDGSHGRSGAEPEEHGGWRKDGRRIKTSRHKELTCFFFYLF